MIRNLTLILITIFALSACNQCNVNKGNYSSAGGNEYKTKMTLSIDNEFIIKNESWLPGQYEKRDSSQLHGTWSCDNNTIKLKTNDSTYTADFIIIGENPLGFDASSKAIMFNENTGVSYLNKLMLYPDYHNN